MRSMLRRWPLETVTAVVFGATLIAVALGSSSVPEISTIGRPLRWIVLGSLLVAACALAARSPGARAPGRALLLTSTTFVGLAVVSATWSSVPRITLERAVTLGIAFTVAGALAIAVPKEPRLARLLLWAIVGASAATVVAGLVLVAISPGYAIQESTDAYSARFRGLGQNPNTFSMLYALATPAAAWLAFATTSKGWRLAARGSFVLLVVAIVVSGSRGAVLGSTAGLVVVALTALRGRRLVAVLLIVVGGYAFSVWALDASKWNYQPDTITSVTSTVTPAASTPTDVGNLRPVEPIPNDPNEIGRPAPGGAEPLALRTVLGSSGRLQAWKGAIRQVMDRPLLGYGFGTEEYVFVDRYYTFQGSRAENGLIGTALQLGLVGLAILASLVIMASAQLVPLLRKPHAGSGVATPLAGIVAAGIILTLIQSYPTSVGNVAMLTFWTALFLAGRGAPAAGSSERG